VRSEEVMEQRKILADALVDPHAVEHLTSARLYVLEKL
jgi:hypothetical protein